MEWFQDFETEKKTLQESPFSQFTKVKRNKIHQKNDHEITPIKQGRKIKFECGCGEIFTDKDEFMRHVNKYHQGKCINGSTHFVCYPTDVVIPVSCRNIVLPDPLPDQFDEDYSQQQVLIQKIEQNLRSSTNKRKKKKSELVTLKWNGFTLRQNQHYYKKYNFYCGRCLQPFDQIIHYLTHCLETCQTLSNQKSSHFISSQDENEVEKNCQINSDDHNFSQSEDESFIKELQNSSSDRQKIVDYLASFYSFHIYKDIPKQNIHLAKRNIVFKNPFFQGEQSSNEVYICACKKKFHLLQPFMVHKMFSSRCKDLIDPKSSHLILNRKQTRFTEIQFQASYVKQNQEYQEKINKTLYCGKCKVNFYKPKLFYNHMFSCKSNRHPQSSHFIEFVFGENCFEENIEFVEKLYFSGQDEKGISKNKDLEHQKNKPKKIVNKPKKIVNKPKQMVNDFYLKMKEERPKNYNNLIIYCGKCKVQMSGTKFINHYTRIHREIVPTGSSHIFLLFRSRKIIEHRFTRIAFKVESSNDEQQLEYYCPCNSNVTMSRKAFVDHVFRYHYGVTPMKQID